MRAYSENNIHAEAHFLAESVRILKAEFGANAKARTDLNSNKDDLILLHSAPQREHVEVAKLAQRVALRRVITKSPAMKRKCRKV